MLVVQAGPGIPMIHEARAFERALRLESCFRVVYWDQRGAGKSLGRSRGAGPMGLDDLAADVLAVLDTLASRLGVAAVDVVGVSLGGSAAAVAAARDPRRFRSLTMVGPDIVWEASERFAHEFALEEARRRGHRRALRSLRRIGPPPHLDRARFAERVRWVTEFGGIHRRERLASLARAHAWRLLASPHYSLGEAVAALRGMLAPPPALFADLQGLDLATLAPRLLVPVALFQGRYDVAAPAYLAERYFQSLEAPRGKRWVGFEDSAHMPHLEEPERFRAALLAGVEESGPRAQGVSGRRPLAGEVGV